MDLGGPDGRAGVVGTAHHLGQRRLEVGGPERPGQHGVGTDLPGQQRAGRTGADHDGAGVAGPGVVAGPQRAEQVDVGGAEIEQDGVGGVLETLED